MKAKLIRILLNLSARLPFSVSHRLGNWLGMLMQRFNNQQRHVAQINLNRCFPELDPVEQRQLLRDTLRETGKLLFESGHLWLGDEAHVSRLVQEVHGEEHIKNGLTSGKGVILAVPHLGNWEVLGVYCSSRYPMTSLYRPPRVEGIEILIRQARERFGAKLAPTNAKGIRALYQALANNELVAILPDQDPRDSGGVFAPFFGIQTNTMTLLSRLVSKSQATVLCSYAERLSDNRGFAIHFEPAPAGIYAKNVEESVTALNQMVEQSIRRIPTQYQWGYKRFRTRPAGEKNIYDEP